MARDWDATTYERLSQPLAQMGRDVLARLELDGDETVLDAGCGTGKVTAALLERLPSGRLIAVDAAPSMVDEAKQKLPDSVDVRQADLLDLELDEPVDAILSTATFHWIADHDALFAHLRRALKPGGRLVAQCGGQGNVADHAKAIVAVATRAEYAGHFEGLTTMWNFAGPEETEERLRAAGFAEARCWLGPKPVPPSAPLRFTMPVTRGPPRARLPEKKRLPFAEAVLERSPRPLTLDYVRLNIEASVA